ncbi:MAG: gamma-glutamyltransferase, partial [Calditrichaeota bacterium]|nr:gamma-glutamyltransferase [Calditrichota bacterium]
HQWLPDQIRLEGLGFSKDTIAVLKKKGHRVTFRETQGRAMAIFIDPETGRFSGGADARSPNRAAAGY